MLDVEAHGLQDALLGLLDGLPETVDAGEIITVGVVTLAFAFDGNGIAVESHAEIELTTKRSGRLGAKAEMSAPKISAMENEPRNLTIGTLIRVAHALDSKVEIKLVRRQGAKSGRGRNGGGKVRTGSVKTECCGIGRLYR